MSGLPSWARVGAKVVCVNAKHSWLVEKRVYRIADLGDEDSTGPVISVEGVMMGNRLARWFVGRFRPLITLEDDISTHFRQLLDVPARHGADA
jgi:hypothetical protein